MYLKNDNLEMLKGYSEQKIAKASAFVDVVSKDHQERKSIWLESKDVPEFLSFDESQKIVGKLREVAGRDFWPEIGGNEMLALVNIAVATWIAKQFNTTTETRQTAQKGNP